MGQSYLGFKFAVFATFSAVAALSASETFANVLKRFSSEPRAIARLKDP